jgi:polyhydroxyalkanoate synthesis regulator phasin
VLSENSAELQNLSEQFQLFKSSFAEVEDLVRDSSTEVDGDGAGNLKSLESSLESLKQELAESESKREENKKVMLSLLDQFNAFEKSQTGSQATDESVSDGGNDDQSSDDRLSELTEKIVGLSQRIYELENEEPPPPPPIDEKEEFSSDEILTRDDISALVTEQLGEATPVDTSTDLTSRIEELENKLEESLESVRDAEEPPPPPPVPSFNASEEIEELNTKLSQSIDSLEERMSKISDHLKANVDEVDLGDSSSTVVLDGNDDVTNTGSGLSSVDDSVAAVSTSGSEKKELDEVDKLVKVDPQSNYSDSNEISPQMTMNSDDENQDPEVTTEDEAGEQDAVESDGNEELTIKKNTRTYNDSRKYKIKLLKNRNET